VVQLGPSHAHGALCLLGMLGAFAIRRQRRVKHRDRWRAARD
jgi:MYXO-CTERM domain-containing protein